MNKYKVVIADSQYLSRQGLKGMIGSKPFYEVVGEAKRHEDLEKLLNKQKVEPGDNRL